MFNVNIGSFITYGDVAGMGGIPIHFDIRIDDFMHKYHDIRIGHAMIYGAYASDMVWIRRSKRITFGRLDTFSNVSHSNIVENVTPVVKTRGNTVEPNKNLIYIRNSEHIRIANCDLRSPCAK